MEVTSRSLDSTPITVLPGATSPPSAISPPATATPWSRPARFRSSSPSSRTTRIFGRILDMLDAVVMVGGADLDPRRDGFMLHPSVRPLDRRREEFDRKLMGMIVASPDARVRHRRRHAVAERHARRQPVPPHPRGPARGAAPLRPDGSRPSPRPGGRDGLADGAGLRRGRDPRQQHAPHGGRRSRARLRRHRPMPRRRRRGHRKHRRELVRPGHPVPSRRPTPPRPWTCGSSRNSSPAWQARNSSMRLVA